MGVMIEVICGQEWQTGLVEFQHEIGSSVTLILLDQSIRDNYKFYNIFYYYTIYTKQRKKTYNGLGVHDSSIQKKCMQS